MFSRVLAPKGKGRLWSVSLLPAAVFKEVNVTVMAGDTEKAVKLYKDTLGLGL